MKISTKINMFLSYDQNRHFGEFWQKSRFMQYVRKFKLKINIYDQIADFQQISPQAIFSKILMKIEIFRKFLTKIEIFANFDPGRHFLKILTIINIFCNFVQNDILVSLDQNREFPTILTKIEDFSKILTKLEISVNFDQNREFSTSLTKIEIFWKFLLKSIFSKSLGKIKVFLKILTKINVILSLDQNRHFG